VSEAVIPPLVRCMLAQKFGINSIMELQLTNVAHLPINQLYHPKCSNMCSSTENGAAHQDNTLMPTGGTQRPSQITLISSNAFITKYRLLRLRGKPASEFNVRRCSTECHLHFEHASGSLNCSVKMIHFSSSTLKLALADFVHNLFLLLSCAAT